MEPASGRITLLLRDVEDGSDAAKAALFDALHGELVRIAAVHMGRQRKDHTLQPTALVNEAYLKLFHADSPSFRDRAHFMAAASRAMRSVLVDMARSRATDKRGGELVRITLASDAPGKPQEDCHDVLAVHEALERMEKLDAQWAIVVEMRFFGGLSAEETAANLGISEPTVNRVWNRARAWLLRELSR